MIAHHQIRSESPLGIETERLLLRPHRLEDADARASFAADAHAMRFIGGPQSGEESWARLLRYGGHWRLFGWGPYAVIEKAGGRLVGELGLMHFRRGLGADFDPAPEALWVLASGAAGRGYADEAMRAVIAAHEARNGALERLVCVIGTENAPSLRLAEKLGFVRFAERDYKGKPCVLLERR